MNNNNKNNVLMLQNKSREITLEFNKLLHFNNKDLNNLEYIDVYLNEIKNLINQTVDNNIRKRNIREINKYSSETLKKAKISYSNFHRLDISDVNIMDIKNSSLGIIGWAKECFVNN